MKTILKHCCFVLTLCATINLNAQLSVEGNIDNWKNGPAMLAFSDMFSGNLDNWGSITTDGVITMSLEYDYMEIFKKKAEAAQKEAPSGWKMSFKTVGDTFVCSDSEKPLQYENEGTTLTGIPDLFVASQNGDTNYGTLFTVSNPEIAKWLYSYGEDNPTTGYYLRWIYVENEAAVSGECVMPTYTGNGNEMFDDTTTYNLKLEEGWNMVKHEITEVFKSDSGKVFPLKTTVSTIQFLPEDLQWIVMGAN